MPRIFRVIVPVEDLALADRFYCADPFGNPLCFVDAATLFTGSRPPD